MNGCGYPAIEGPTKTGKNTYDFTANWLDDDGRPLPNPFRLYAGLCVVSPLRVVAVSPGSTSHIHDVTLAWRDGRRTKLTIENNLYTKLLAPTDDGRFHDGRNAYDRNGALVLAQPGSGELLSWVQSVDSRYLAFQHWTPAPRLTELVLFDTATGKKVWATTRSTLQPGVIFHEGKDFLFIPKNGLLQRFTGSGRTAIVSGPGGGAETWWWGEDGTVWTVGGNGSIQIYDRRKAALRKLPMTALTDDRIHALANCERPSPYEPFPRMNHHAGFPGVAVWDGGRLVATVETRKAWPRPVNGLFMKAGKKYPSLRKLHRELRWLTLYRDRRKIGRYAVGFDPDTMLPSTSSGIMRWYDSMRISKTGRLTVFPPPILACEHLAFNKDGTRLAWVRETTKGKTIYVFKVPGGTWPLTTSP
jgi:hypothetical protein